MIDSVSVNMNRNRRNTKCRIISILLAASMMLALAGCGGDGDASGVTNTDTADTAAANAGDSAGAQDGKTASAGGQTAMGRYVEEEIDLSERLASARTMCMLEDGSIALLDSYKGILISRDQGATWSDETPEWFTDMFNERLYIGEMAMTPDGTAIVVYDSTPGDDDYKPLAKLILPDGTEVPVETDFEEEDKYFRQVIASDEGRIFGNTFGSIYEIYTDGSSEKILTPEDADYIWAKGNLLFVDSAWEAVESPVIYDLDKGGYVEDSVLIEFIEENYAGRRYNGSDYGTMYLVPGDDETVYVVGEKGIHRHVIGGNMMEQIVDGNLSMLSNPQYSTVAMLQLEDNIFLALFANYKMIRFTYDPDVPSVPENMLTIYSLRDDEDLRQAISYYQTTHPDTFVSYEIGMSEGDSVTREDAVKKLNTEIMAGTGPDLIVLDDLPFKSYVNKGLLLDLTDYFTQYSVNEPLFDNVIEAIKIDNKAYMAPATIAVPLIAAGEGCTENMTKLSDVGEAVEKQRAEHPGENIIGICSESGVMKRFAATSAPEWVMENGTLDLEGIGEYLEQCKRIYAAQMDGLDDDIARQYAERSEYLAAYEGIDVDRMNWEIAADVFSYIGGTQYILTGWVDATYSYEEMLSLDKAEGFEDSRVISMEGQCSDVFLPQTLLGINAMSGHVDAAKGFMDVFLSAQAQSEYYGLPLNREAFDMQFTPNEDYLGENGEYGYLSVSTADGLSIDYTVYWPEDEQIAAFKSQLASVNTAYIPDSVLEGAVFESGSAYMQGSLSLQEALDEIEKAVAIYMAE